MAPSVLGAPPAVPASSGPSIASKPDSDPSSPPVKPLMLQKKPAGEKSTGEKSTGSKSAGSTDPKASSTTSTGKIDWSALKQQKLSSIRVIDPVTKTVITKMPGIEHGGLAPGMSNDGLKLFLAAREKAELDFACYESEEVRAETAVRDAVYLEQQAAAGEDTVEKASTVPSTEDSSAGVVLGSKERYGHRETGVITAVQILDRTKFFLHEGRGPPTVEEFRTYLQKKLNRPPTVGELQLITEANDKYLRDNRHGAAHDSWDPPSGDIPDFYHWSMLQEDDIPAVLKTRSKEDLVTIVKTIQKHYHYGYDSWHWFVRGFSEGNTRDPRANGILFLASFVVQYKRDLMDGKIPFTPEHCSPYNADKGKGRWSGKGKGSDKGYGSTGSNRYGVRHSDWDNSGPYSSTDAPGWTLPREGEGGDAGRTVAEPITVASSSSASSEKSPGADTP